MSYIDVISLETAKNWLRVDDDLTEDDASITAMINASLRYIENYTNIFVYARDKDYDVDNGVIRVYDYPINTVITEDVASEKRSLYTNFCTSFDVDSIQLNVGYVDPLEVPDDIIQVALEMIDIYYYMQKGGDSKEAVSPLNKLVLDSNKRFII